MLQYIFDGKSNVNDDDFSLKNRFYRSVKQNVVDGDGPNVKLKMIIYVIKAFNQ